MRTDELKKTYEKFGALYPIITDKNGEIIDGFHRNKVDPNWPRMKIDTDDNTHKAKLALIANINRREITGEEITKRLDNLANITGWKPKQIAEEVGMSERWVYKYISQKYKSEPIAAVPAHRARMTDTDYENIEPTDNGSETTMTKEEVQTLDGVWPEPIIYNVWETEGRREVGYGDCNFHGNTPPIILQQCITKYTNEGDTVLEPMAGSGTTIDVCKELKRKCVAFDIKPMRDDIQRGDSEKIQMDDDSVDFIFAHWPYWKMSVYSDNSNDLSNMSMSEFKIKSESIINEFKRVLKEGGFCTILIGDIRQSGLIDLSAVISEIGSQTLKLYDKVVWVAKSQRSLNRVGKNLSEYRAKKHNYHVQTFDTLLIFRKVSK